MGGKAVLVLFPTEKSAKILKWKVNEGTLVNVGRVILLYDVHTTNGQVEPKKLKATHVGTVRKLLAKEGDIVQPGSAILELEECMHPTVFKDMCAECGIDLRKEEKNELNASVPMVHSIPELKVSEAQAQILGKADEARLLKHKKLVLLVDLDQTLIHTTNDNIPANLKDVYHFQLYGAVSPWYHTRLRPGTHKFLSEMSDFYELHICTFGARNYAHMIAMFLDPDGKFFSHRILSRDECFDPNSKTANLKALFPCGDNMVCIIDDREDVWNYASNLIHVKPYHFFQHTGDINAPPGLDKHESDDKEGFDFTNLEADKETPDTKLKVGRRRGSSTLTDNEENDPKEADTREIRTSGEDVDCAANDNIGDKLGGLEIETPNKSVDTCVPKTETRTENNEIASDHSTLESMCAKIDEVKSEVQTNKLNDDVASAQTEVKTTDSDSVGVNTTISSDSQQSVVSNISSVSTNLTPPSPVSSSDNERLAVDMDCKAVKEHDAETNKSDEELVEVEDSDDYLLYLEEILKMIHKTFFEHYENLKTAVVPDLKQVIPEVRSKVLAGARLVFSGLVPTHVPLEQSRAYLVARSLGAHVTQDLEPTTTHLVAVRSGTAKVNAARRIKGIVKVTPNWLWCCAERWERVEEKLFPLGQNGAAYRHPPAHCASPEHVASTHGRPGARRRTPSGRFMDSINPLMSFSMEDIANMDKEVEDIFNESDESEAEEEEEELEKEKTDETLVFVRRDDEDSIDAESCASDLDSLSDSEDVPHGWGGEKRAATDDSDEEMPSVKFRRGEALPSDVEQDESRGSMDPPDEEDDGDWNMMGAALEREFLSGDARD